ncbi:ATP-binding protein [Streptomyces sp. NPDC090022]|uniref:ATP-binding protein n=1 Tax=Streptomyces sp. NPDC090022 TaxID=3365920 RepID=UPI0037F42385
MLTAPARTIPRPVSPGRDCAHWAARPTPATVPLVRSRVRAVLEGWQVSLAVADALVLAVSELVGNAVRHAARASDRLGVSVTLVGGWLQLEVTDGDPALPPPVHAVDAEAEGGRGLLIVTLLLAEVGGELAVLAHEFGKTARVRIPVA